MTTLEVICAFLLAFMGACSVLLLFVRVLVIWFDHECEKARFRRDLARAQREEARVLGEAHGLDYFAEPVRARRLERVK